MTMQRLVLVGGLVSMLAGCSSFSGLAGSKSDLACKAPDGVICTSVSGIYANSLEDALPGQLNDPARNGTIKKATATDHQAGAPISSDPPAYSPRVLVTPESGDPLRQSPLVLRVWIAPWEDTDGDLHDQHYVYMVVNNGKWLIESNQQAIHNAYRPVFPLGKLDTEMARPEAASRQPPGVADK